METGALLGNQPTGKKREREKARRRRRPARALPGMMGAPWTTRRRVRTPIRPRRCRGGGQTRDAFVRTPGPRRPRRRQPRHFQTEKNQKRSAVWCSIGRGRKLRRVAGRRGARRGRIAASSPTRCPGDARGVPRVRIPSRARPRGHLPGVHRAKPRRFFATPNSIWRRVGGRTFAVQRRERRLSPRVRPHPDHSRLCGCRRETARSPDAFSRRVERARFRLPETPLRTMPKPTASSNFVFFACRPERGDFG